ncbi:MAG TPA: MauE/DoxX family redox-associated membrane protein [Pyrinomonadaceae bacterium]|nr:MauE/DoxX family redox-associated membrane protein [Pyrinomonadaceae bacterium]
MNRRRLFKVLVQLSRFGLAALFLLTAGAKLYTFNDFVGNLSNLVWTGWAWPAAVVVITAEVVAALLLLLPPTVRWGGVWSATLLIGFAAYALYYVKVKHGEPLECGCFGGIIASQLGVSTALRNLGLLVPAALVIFGFGRTRREGQPEAFELPTPSPPSFTSSPEDV